MIATKRRLIVALRKKILKERNDLPRGIPYAKIIRNQILAKEKQNESKRT
jgi:hypothetical protein